MESNEEEKKDRAPAWARGRCVQRLCLLTHALPIKAARILHPHFVPTLRHRSGIPRPPLFGSIIAVCVPRTTSPRWIAAPLLRLVLRAGSGDVSWWVGFRGYGGFGDGCGIKGGRVVVVVYSKLGSIK